MPQFESYIGIDYSGAETPTSRLKGLQVYAADWQRMPTGVAPPSGPRKYWTRKGIAEWLVSQLSGPKLMLVGFDHGFSFPIQYFDRYRLPPDWPVFLDDFQKHWPTDEDRTSVCSVRDGKCGQGASRQGDPAWLRLTERWTATAKSVFQFDVPGQVAPSTHAGLPWLRFIRQRCGGRVHFWPLDGWEVPPGRSVLAEVYPALWMKRFPVADRSADQHAAYAAAAWLRRADINESLSHFLAPPLEAPERTRAKIEGWILGVT